MRPASVQQRVGDEGPGVRRKAARIGAEADHGRLVSRPARRRTARADRSRVSGDSSHSRTPCTATSTAMRRGHDGGDVEDRLGLRSQISPTCGGLRMARATPRYIGRALRRGKPGQRKKGGLAPSLRVRRPVTRHVRTPPYRARRQALHVGSRRPSGAPPCQRDCADNPNRSVRREIVARRAAAAHALLISSASHRPDAHAVPERDGGAAQSGTMRRGGQQ